MVSVPICPPNVSYPTHFAFEKEDRQYINKMIPIRYAFSTMNTIFR